MEKITCPRCGKRLFDVAGVTTGTVIIKCTRCKTLVSVDITASEPKEQRQASATRAESSR